MKKTKKTLLALGSLASIAVPVGTVVACGSSSSSTTTDPMISIQNYVENGTTVTDFLPTDQNEWYSPIIGDRTLDDSGNGITPFGLFSGVTSSGGYKFGTLENGIAENLGYLQTGKLLMMSYYAAHPITDKNDIRSSLSRLGTVLDKTIQTYATKKIDAFKADLTKLGVDAAEITKIATVLQNFKTADVIKSSAQNLTKYDYLGLKGLDAIFTDAKYVNAVEGSKEGSVKQATMGYVNGFLDSFAWDLHEDFLNNTVEDNITLLYAYDEVIGYSWDAYTGVMGDRGDPSPTLLKPYVEQPLALDHNELISNWNVTDPSKRVLKTNNAVPGGSNPYANQLYWFAADIFTPDDAIMPETQNDTLAKGINTVDTGNARYGSDGNLVSGTKTTRHLEFGLFDSVTLTDDSDVKHVFDSDANDAKDTKSINGDTFKQLIETKLKNITVHVRDGKKWQDSKGQDTTEEVKAEDFWTYLQWDSYSDDSLRNKSATWGGANQLPTEPDDDAPRNSIAKSVEDQIGKSAVNKYDYKAPSKTDLSIEPYFWNLAGTSYGMEPFKDTTARHDEIVKSGNNLSFDFNTDADGSNAQLFWNQSFAKPGIFQVMALPTDKIKSVSKKFVDAHADLTGSGIDQATLDASPAVKYGIYFNRAAQSISDFYFAGKYITKEVGAKSTTVIQNTNYSGTWVNKNKAPTSFVNRYIDQSGAYGATFKDDYENGEIYKVELGDKHFEGWKNDILQKSEADGKAYGLTYVKIVTSQGDVGKRFFQLGLPFSPTSSEDAKYYFNDNFAKVLYGGTMKELWQEPTLEKLVENEYHGAGLEFRSSIQTAINIYALVNDNLPHAQGAMAKYGPEAVIPGTGTSKTVIETKIFNRAAFGKNFVEVSDKDYRDRTIAAEGTSAFVLGGTLMDKLKENIADALEQAGVATGSSLISELPIDYKLGLNSINTATGLQNHLEALNSLNEQINFVAIVNPVQSLK